MDKKVTEKELLLAVLSRLDTSQVLGILEDIGRTTPYGEALCRVLEEECDRDSGAVFSMEELKEILKKELENAQDSRREFFQELIHFADRAQKTDAQIYNAIGMNRSLWYRLRDKKDAKTNKKNVLKMAIVLRLDYWEMYYLVSLAGYSLLPADDKTDQVVSFCVRHNIYDTGRVDELLAEAGENTLFSEK